MRAAYFIVRESLLRDAEFIGERLLRQTLFLAQFGDARARGQVLQYSNLFYLSLFLAAKEEKPTPTSAIAGLAVSTAKATATSPSDKQSR